MLRKQPGEVDLTNKIRACTSFLGLKSLLGQLSPIEAHYLCARSGSDIAEAIVPKALSLDGHETVSWFHKGETFFTERCGLREKVRELGTSVLEPAILPSKPRPRPRPHQKIARDKSGKVAYPKKEIRRAKTIDGLIQYLHTLSFIHDTRLQNGYFTSDQLIRLIQTGAIRNIPATFGLRRKVSLLLRQQSSAPRPTSSLPLGRERNFFSHLRKRHEEKLKQQGQKRRAGSNLSSPSSEGAVDTHTERHFKKQKHRHVNHR